MPWVKTISLIVVSVAAGIGVGILKGPPVGVAATFATGMALICWIWLFKPPSSQRGREDSASINFGHRPERRTRTRANKPAGPQPPPRRRKKRR